MATKSAFARVDANSGDTITGEVEVTKVRADKRITELETRVVRADNTVLLDGNAVCYKMPLQQ